MSISRPCRDCQKRYVGCHIACELYLAFRGEVDAVREAQRVEANKSYMDIYRHQEAEKIVLKRRQRGRLT